MQLRACWAKKGLTLGGGGGKKTRSGVQCQVIKNVEGKVWLISQIWCPDLDLVLLCTADFTEEELLLTENHEVLGQLCLKWVRDNPPPQTSHQGCIQYSPCLWWPHCHAWVLCHMIVPSLTTGPTQKTPCECQSFGPCASDMRVGP
jgi:hypothetical protein